MFPLIEDKDLDGEVTSMGKTQSTKFYECYLSFVYLIITVGQINLTTKKSTTLRP